MKYLGRAGTTFGTVITAALLFALVGAGGAVAATLITSAKIKNNTIQSIDVRNENLTGTDIRNGALGGADVGDGTLTGADVADGTLTGADIGDGSVAKADLSGAAQGFVSVVTKRESVAIDGSGTNTRAVFCPEGSVAIGGGGYVAPTGFVLIGSTSGETVRSHPVVAGGFGGSGTPAGDNVAATGWRSVVRNLSADPSTAVHYAICATK